jgi:hypothetical protein
MKQKSKRQNQHLIIYKSLSEAYFLANVSGYGKSNIELNVDIIN